MSEEEVEIIYQAIEYHNHLALPVMSNETIYTLGTILRDADKLDAFYLSTSNDSRSYSFDELSNEALYSEEIISSILNSKQADFREIKYKYDRDLSVIALIFNLEFNEAFQIVKANNYIERMFDAIPSDERLMSAKGHCMKYIDAKIR